ncbi:hypothetical protein ABZ650_32160 [Streptomyces griseoviridis]|uniref:hypothetical protein n=1 Tax=Streptomyces griseoviridis TaxID=45398 RepID=UPI00340C40FF
MIIVIADPSGLLAALDSTHPEHGGANEAIMLDRRDFRAVRPLGRHKTFRVLPDDLPL